MSCPQGPSAMQYGLCNMAPGFFSQIHPLERAKIALNCLEKHSGGSLFSPLPLKETVLVL